eukprot:582666-Ditylum_brightwellii.AAC.1
MEKLKEIIKDVKLSSYPGENIVNKNQHIRALCDRLWLKFVSKPTVYEDNNGAIRVASYPKLAPT